MPDIHSFCVDLEQGLKEYKELYERYTDLTNATGVRYAVAFRIVADFYYAHKEEILEMVRYGKQPVFVELLSGMKHYWVMKHEINTIDTQGGTCQTSTVQLDIKDASLYGINYIDESGSKRGCTIVHSSIGSPERWLFSVLEDALRKTPPVLPLWLAPVQVRVLPVSDKRHLDFCVRIAEQLRAAQIRAEVDDRSKPMNWSIRSAERDWVPFIVVCGDKEVSSNLLSVRVRGAGQEKIELPALIERIKAETRAMPFRQLPGLLLSKRPVFRGRD
jgi:threonyl-tRNA synthetase